METKRKRGGPRKYPNGKSAVMTKVDVYRTEHQCLINISIDTGIPIYRLCSDALKEYIKDKYPAYVISQVDRG